MRNVICTTGTSIALGCGRISPDVHAEEYLRKIRERVKDLRDKEATTFLQKVSAETNSLHKFGLEREDRVTLLHTETEEGRICAEALADLIRSTLCPTCSLQQVAGLQVTTAKAFRREGIQNLVRTMDRLRTDAPVSEWVLNVTGGYKSVVPYMTIYGLIHGLDIIYLHETSAELIHFPPLPLTFDFEHIGAFRDAIRTLQENEVMKTAEFEALIPGELRPHREWLRSLVDEEDGFVSPSGLASLFFKESDAHTVQVLISPQAQTELNNSSSFVRKQYLSMLDRVSDPLWRDSKHHAVHGTNLTVWKPGNVSERLLGFVRGNRIFVCELAQHERYESLLKTRTLNDYPEKSFTVYTAPPDARNLPESEEAELRRLTEQLAQKERDEELLLREMQDFETTEQNYKRTIDKEITRVAELEAQLEQAKAFMNLPRWKRIFCTPPVLDFNPQTPVKE